MRCIRGSSQHKMASWYGIESQINEARQGNRQGNRQDKGVGGTDLATDEATSKGMEANGHMDVVIGHGEIQWTSEKAQE